MVQLTEAEKKALARYELIVSILKNNNDRRGLVLIQELIEKCIAYFDLLSIITASEEFRSMFSKKTKDLPPVPMERLAAMEQTRSGKHNDVIWKIDEVNIYLFREYGELEREGLIPNGGIYPDNPAHVREEGIYKYRKDITNWVINLINALYKKGLVSL